MSGPIFQPAPDPVPASWAYGFDSNGAATAFFPGSVNISGALLATYLASQAGAVARSISSKLGDWVSVKDFGATGLNITSDAFAFTAAASASQFVYVPAGLYLIGSNVTLGASFQFSPGAVLYIPNGVTVTINGQICNTGVWQIFSCSGTGAVVLNTAYNLVGFPEWWGAVVNNAAFDCRPAIQACVLCLPVTQFQAASYWVQSPLQFTTAAYQNRTLLGVPGGIPCPSDSSTVYTRILINNGSQDVCQVGYTADPGGINNFFQGFTIRDVFFTRSVAPVAGGGLNACAGLRVEFSLYCFFERVLCQEHEIGIAIGPAVVYTKFVDCKTFRSLAATGGGTDIWYGFSLYPDATYGLQTVYFNRCVAGIGGTPGVPGGSAIGFATNGCLTDTWFDQCEVAACDYGMFFNASAATRASYDIHITNCDFDQVNYAGINFYDFTLGGAITVVGGYCALSASANAIGCIVCNVGNANVMVTNFQGIGVTSTVGAGLDAVSWEGLSFKNNVWQDCKAPYVINGCRDGVFDDMISSLSGHVGIGAAVAVTNSSTRNVFRLAVNGNANGLFTAGYTFDSTCTYNDVYVSGVDPLCLPSASPNTKLVYNGANVTAAGVFGTTNLASGIFN